MMTIESEEPMPDVTPTATSPHDLEPPARRWLVAGWASLLAFGLLAAVTLGHRAAAVLAEPACYFTAVVLGLAALVATTRAAHGVGRRVAGEHPAGAYVAVLLLGLTALVLVGAGVFAALSLSSHGQLWLACEQRPDGIFVEYATPLVLGLAGLVSLGLWLVSLVLTSSTLAAGARSRGLGARARAMPWIWASAASLIGAVVWAVVAGAGKKPGDGSSAPAPPWLVAGGIAALALVALALSLASGLARRPRVAPEALADR